MKNVALILFVSALGLAALGFVSAQDAAKPVVEPRAEDLDALLSYLGSPAPEQRNRAEKLLAAAAANNFETLVERLSIQPPRSRELLLKILVSTNVPARVPLCVNTLCRQDARRRERLYATEALRSVEQSRVLAALKERLAAPALSDYERVQCYRSLGELTLPEAQAFAEKERDAATPESLIAFFAEDALLRSTLASDFAQPAWSRYQRRHKDAPKPELRVISSGLGDLAQPAAVDRAEAEYALADMIGSDPRVWLALSRSIEPERAALALAVLRRRAMGIYALATQAVMLDLVTTGEKMTALLAVDVAVAGAPPAPEDLKKLRPVVSGEAMGRLEAVLEGLTAAGNLAELRSQRARVEAELVPLLRRFGPGNDETRDLMAQLAEIGAKLDGLERVWRRGWRREFEADILGLKSK
jgi:hypothetical protein